MTSAYELDLVEASKAIDSGELSAVELLESTLRRLGDVEPSIRAFVDVYEDEAFACAQEVDKGHARGLRGPLRGIPVAIKDIIDVFGHSTRAGSPTRSSQPAVADAAIVSTLRSAGAIIIGKTVTHELAFGVTSPPTRNPWDPDRVPGGSSGGSSAAVAARCALIGIGSDTGGSIRSPAALCGVVGLKPTHGVISTQGVLANSWSLDALGPITRTVADAGLALDVLAPSTKRTSSPNSARPDRVRVGIPDAFFSVNIRDDVAAGICRIADGLTSEGVHVVSVGLSMTESIVPVYSVIQGCEASANLRPVLQSDPTSIGEPIRRVLQAGLELPAWAYLDALRVREVVAEAFKQTFRLVDVLLTPTTPVPAMRIGEESFQWPDATVESIWSLYSRLCIPANVVGMPAISVPGGLTEDGLPFGAQLLAAPNMEASLLAVGRLVEDISASSRGSLPDLLN